MITQSIDQKGRHFIQLDSMRDWEKFALDNRTALEDEYGSLTQAQRHLLDGGIVLAWVEVILREPTDLWDALAVAALDEMQASGEIA